MEGKSCLTFSFCGDNEVSALAVSDAIKSLVELSTVIYEKEYPDVEFRLTVRAVNPGSLEFVFSAAAFVTGTLLSPENVNYAADLISVMGATFSIKKFLAGKPPKSVKRENGRTVVINANGIKGEFPVGAGVFFVDNRVDNSVRNIINCASLSDGVTGISIDANGKIEISREEFDDCFQKLELDLLEDKSDVEPIVSMSYKQVLFIRQVDFSGDLKWRFTRINDENITASILDKDFMEKVHSGGQNINANMYLIADVQSTVHILENGRPDKSKCTYEIIKVHSIKSPGDGQITFDV